jgi:outer membrane protein OmpA-like peptidoglycan-associated protein
VQALVIGLLPLGTAFAQSGPSVRVTNEETEITARTHGNGGVIMTAARGTVLTVIDTDGDRYAHRRSNWYWVLLPRDAWGATRGGWISGRDVDYVPPTAIPMAAAVDTVFVKVQTTQQGFNEHSTIARALDAESRPPVAASSAPASPAASPAPAAAPAAAPCPCATEFSEMVVLNFEFAKSELTIEAKGKLASAVATLKTNGHGVSFALEGHADWIGSEPYNDRLGRARAETVKKYLADLHQIPADKISVVSYGESKPAASNATPDGRAQNRRVVVKVGA